MSLLSKLTGIGISRKGIKIDPLKAAMTALTVGTLGGGAGLGFLGGAAKLGKLAKIGAGAKAAGGFLKNNAKTIADYGQLGEGVYDRMQENKVAGQAQDRYRALAPVRSQALAALNAPTPDVHSLFADPDMQAGAPRYRRVGIGSGGL